MRSFRSICVFCGASSGRAPVYAEAARELGRYLALRGIELVTGGGRVGLMGAVADGALEAGGRAVGVIPGALMDRELGHPGLTELLVVGGMHARKKAMADRAEAFIAMPGGFGTLDELMEATTWAQLGLHRKPIGLLNVAGYYTPLCAFLDQARDAGFLRARDRALIAVGETPELLLDRLAKRG